MKKRIIKIGNSAGVILPKEVREEAGLKLGDNVAIAYSSQEEGVVIGKQENKKNNSPITPEFHDWLKRFNKRHKKALSELAKK
jgi:putative addiction module antidote